MPYALMTMPTVSFWEKRPDPIPLDYEKISDLFRAKISAKKKPVGATAAAPTELQVLDMKRATAVGVLMSRVGLPAHQLVHAVYELDTKVLCGIEEVDTVLKCLPTPDEMIKLQPYLAGKRPISDLTPVELFILDLAKTPQIDLRLSTFRYKYSIPESLESAFTAARCRQAAVKQVVASKTFSALLVAVLAVGNYLNQGTTNGEAVAFKLPALTKLVDTKSIDGDESLLSFFASSLIDAGLEPLGSELPACLSTGIETTLEEVSSTIERTKEQLLEIQQQVKTLENTQDVYLNIRVFKSKVPRVNEFDSCDPVVPLVSASREGGPTLGHISECPAPTARDESLKPGNEASDSVAGKPCLATDPQQHIEYITVEKASIQLTCDRYTEVMAREVSMLQKQVDELCEIRDAAQEGFSEMVASFGERPQAVKEAEWWTDFTRFLKPFHKLQASIMKARAAEQESEARKRSKPSR